MIRIMVALCVLLFPQLAGADGDLPTRFTNRGSVANTRHNLTQRPLAGGGAIMTPYRNDYDEVCVYCHTPHAASPVQLPLWNHTIESRTYTVYGARSMTLSQTPTAPGLNSLACLACHDGQTAIDSIINMPGSGRYQASQATSVDKGFLSAWTNPSGVSTFAHLSLTECMACHSPGAGIVGSGATSFEAFLIGTDLSNDHPIGVTFPQKNPDYKQPSGVRPAVLFYDRNANGRPDSDEIRLYNTAGTYEVECASCHDPHGVPSAGPGSAFNPTFLRVSNSASQVCLTCHSK